jgi:hypothetical protein
MEDPKSKKTRPDSPGDAGRGVGVPAKGDSSASNPSIGELLRGCRYLLHDRDTKFCASFRELIESGSLETIRLPARSPNLNWFAERWVRSVTSSESLTSPYGNQPIPGTTATVYSVLNLLGAVAWPSPDPTYPAAATLEIAIDSNTAA